MSGDRIKDTGLALIMGAVLAAGQIWLVDRIGVVDLGATFTAGNERSQGAAVTLVGWFCAVAVVLAGRRKPLSAVAAAVGALAALPVVATLADDAIATAALRVAGFAILLGLIAAILVIRVPASRAGVAVHAGVWWVFAVIAALAHPAAGYAGLVELLGFHSVRQWLFPILPSDRILSYHLPYLLPSILATIVAGAVVARVVRRRGGTRVAATAAGSAGMLLAVAAYLIDVRQLTMWNGEVFVLVLATALLTMIVSVVAQFRRAVPST